MTKYYTTHEVAKLLPNFNSAGTLLEALHDNQKLTKLNHKGEMENNSASKHILSAIWNVRFKLGKRWLYSKEEIDKIILKMERNV